MSGENPVSQLDIREILAMAWRRKWLIVIPLILVSAIAFAGSYLITPAYESAAIVQIDTQVSLIRELQGLVGDQAGGFRPSRGSDRRDQLQAIYNQVTSRFYISKINEKLQLDREIPEVRQGVAKMLAQRPNLDVPEATANVLQGTLRDNISVNWAAGDQIEITVQSTVPSQARDIANELGTVLIQQKELEELDRIRTSATFSDVQLEKYERELADKIRERTNLEKEQLRIQLDESITSESNRSEIQGEIDQTANEIKDLESEERELAGRLGSVAGLTANRLTIPETAERQRLASELKTQFRSIGDLMVKYTWSDPQILNSKVRQNNILNQIEQLNRQLVQNEFSDVDNATRQTLVRLFDVKTNLDYLYLKKPYLQSAVTQLTSTMNLVPEYQARLNALDREIAAQTDLRDRFKRQQESSSISQALVQDMSSTKYRFIEKAKLELAPVKPNRMKILSMGIVLGLVLGGAAALMVELLDSSFKRPEDIESMLGLEVIGITPRIEHLDKVVR